MTKIYSVGNLNAERDTKEVGTLYREHIKFAKENNREFTPEYTDEQIPVDTVYKKREVGFEYVPRWTGGIVSQKWIDKIGAQYSIRSDGDNKAIETKGDVVSQGKVWASQNDFRITMLDFVPKGIIPTEKRKEFEWMWRVFDKKHNFTDNGRKISIDWGSKWTTMFGSKPTRDMWQEEVRLGNWKFYEDSDSENSDLKDGNWQDVVEAHLKYFSEIITVIMRKHRDKIPVDEATAVAMHAICEFALKVSNEDEGLNARFATSAYSWVRNYYRDAVDTKDVINNKSLQKVQDLRTLTDLLKELSANLDYVTIEDICNASGWGERRVDSTFRVFDFNAGGYRDANNEELLYTIMNRHLTERQCEIVERNFGLGGLEKSSIAEIAEDLNVSFPTVQRDRAKALEIIKEKISFKFL